MLQNENVVINRWTNVSRLTLILGFIELVPRYPTKFFLESDCLLYDRNQQLKCPVSLCDFIIVDVHEPPLNSRSQRSTFKINYHL